MKKKIKYFKIKKEIYKKITKIIIYECQSIFKKKIFININNIYLSNDFSYIIIYINFIKKKNKNKTKYNIKILEKSKKYIIKKLISKIYIKKIPKIYFKEDNFLNKINNLFKKIKIANE